MDRLRNVTRRSKLGLWITAGLVVLAAIAGTGTAIASMGSSQDKGSVEAQSPESVPVDLALVDSTSAIGGAGHAGGAAGSAGGGAAGGGGGTLKVAQYN